jgi:hypothetical protein
MVSFCLLMLMNPQWVGFEKTENLLSLPTNLLSTLADQGSTATNGINHPRFHSYKPSSHHPTLASLLLHCLRDWLAMFFLWTSLTGNVLHARKLLWQEQPGGIKVQWSSNFFVILYVVFADRFLNPQWISMVIVSHSAGHPTGKVCNSAPPLDSLMFFNQLFVHCWCFKLAHSLVHPTSCIPFWIFCANLYV